MPQATEGCVVTIANATISKAGHPTIAVTLKHTFSNAEATRAFLAGKQYNLTFTVSLNKITFTSTPTAWGADTDVPLKN